MKKTRGNSIVANLMAEFIQCGGLLYTRASLYREMIDKGWPASGGFGSADYFAFSPSALSSSEVLAVREYWGSSSVPEGFWNRTGEVETLPLDWQPAEEQTA